MGKRSGPRRGSLAFYPRKRAKRIYPDVKSFKETAEPKILGFPAYKAGMTQIIATETYEKSPAFGKKIAIPVTVLECPPIVVLGIRVYEKTPEGLKTLTEVWAEKLSKNVGRKIILPKNYDHKKRIKEIEGMLSKVKEVRAIIHTQPDKIGLKKTPEIMELKIGGSVEEAWKKGLELLGKEVKISDIFTEGAWVDVIGVTKGKGTQGPVKRFGIKIQTRKAKGHRRMPGAIGAWHPARVLYTVPMTGQMGFQRRTELNKRILKIGTDGKEVTPKGGFVNYGEVKADYILIKGSVPGPKKRTIVIREALRKNKDLPLPSIEQIITKSQQG